MKKQNKKFERTAYDRVAYLFKIANEDAAVSIDIVTAYYIEAIAYMLFKLNEEKLKKIEY